MAAGRGAAAACTLVRGGITRILRTDIVKALTAPASHRSRGWSCSSRGSGLEVAITCGPQVVHDPSPGVAAGHKRSSVPPLRRACRPERRGETGDLDDPDDLWSSWPSRAGELARDDGVVPDDAHSEDLGARPRRGPGRCRANGSRPGPLAADGLLRARGCPARGTGRVPGSADPHRHRSTQPRTTSGQARSARRRRPSRPCP